MATMYLRATGSWSAAGTWSNSSGGVSNGTWPDATTDVVMNAASGAVTVTCAGTSGSPDLCKSVTCTGFTGTFAIPNATQLNVGSSTSGAFLLVSGMTFTMGTTSAKIKFVSTTTGNTLTWASKQVGLLEFDGVGGAWTWGATGTSTATGTGMTITNGSVDINSKNFAGYLICNSGNTRSLTLGTATWTMNNANGATGWDCGDGTNLTLSAASSTISLNSAATNGKFYGGSKTYGTFTASALTTANITVTGNNTFTTLTLSMAGSTKTPTSGYFLGGNQTVSGTFTANGSTALLRNWISSDTPGTARTITVNTTVTVTQTDFRDIIGAGSASWNLSSVTGGAGNGGGCSGITFSSPKNCYMKVGANANWSASNWFTTSGGATPISPAIPMLHDTAIFDANSITAGSVTITLNECRWPATNWTGVTNTPAFTTTITNECYGGLTLVSGMTHTGVGVMTFMGGGSFTLTGGGLTWPTSSTIVVGSPNTTLTLGSNLTSNAGISVTGGTFSQGGYTLSATTGAISSGATWTANGTLTLSSTMGNTDGTFTVSSAMTCTAFTNSGTITSSSTMGCTSYSQTAGTCTLGGTFTGSSTWSVTGGTFDMNGFNVNSFTSSTLTSAILQLSGNHAGGGLTATTATINDTGANGIITGTSVLDSTTAAMHNFNGQFLTIQGTSNVTFNLLSTNLASTLTASGRLRVSGKNSTVTFKGYVTRPVGNSSGIVITPRPVIHPGMNGDTGGLL